MNKTKERLMRDLLAALVGSKISMSDLRGFAQLIGDDRTFCRDLSNLIFEVSFKIGDQSDLPLDQPVYNEEKAGSFGGLTDLAHSVVQRRRFSKGKLLEIFSRFGMNRRRLGVREQASVKELVHAFLENASPDQMQDFMNFLGLDVSQDAYLGVIGGS